MRDAAKCNDVTASIGVLWSREMDSSVLAWNGSRVLVRSDVVWRSRSESKWRDL